MSYTIELEKLTEEQLEAFKVIDPVAYKNEKENRSTYSAEEARKGQIYTDLDKAYYYLKPMYDNMRNTEVKKTITESGILATIEKVFRFTKKMNLSFARFEPEVAVVAGVDYPVTAAPEPKVIKEEAVVLTSAPEPVMPPVPAPEPVVIVAPEAVVAPAPQSVKSTIETISTEELNKIMASIPAVEKI
jgi:hypothetical protein